MCDTQEYAEKAQALPDEFVDLLFEHVVTGTERQAPQWDSLTNRGLRAFIAASSIVAIAPAFAFAPNLPCGAIAFLVLAASAYFIAGWYSYKLFRADKWQVARQSWLILRDAENAQSPRDMKRRMMATAAYAYEENRTAIQRKGDRLNGALIFMGFEIAYLVAAVSWVAVAN